LFQELSGLGGSFFIFESSLFALNCALLFLRKESKYLVSLRFALLFESIYFLLLLPAATNHLVGSVISTSAFLNFYTGVSFLLQVALIFPSLFMLSRKLKSLQNVHLILKWVSIAVPFYVLGLWVKHSLMWVYAISPSEIQKGNLVGAFGFVNSWLTLMVAAVACGAVFLTYKEKNKLNFKLVGTALILVSCYFLVYDVVSIWDSIYRVFLPLTDFWMITLMVVGLAVLLDLNVKGKSGSFSKVNKSSLPVILLLERIYYDTWFA
jgi:hypothetical protein